MHFKTSYETWSLTYGLFWDVDFQVLGKFLLFLIFQLIPFWSENVPCRIPILKFNEFFNIPGYRLFWWMFRGHLKVISSVVVEWSVILYMSIKFSWLIIWFFCMLANLLSSASSNYWSFEILRSPTIIVDLSFSPFNCINFCFVYFLGFVVWWIYI